MLPHIEPSTCARVAFALVYDCFNARRRPTIHVTVVNAQGVNLVVATDEKNERSSESKVNRKRNCCVLPAVVSFMVLLIGLLH